MSDLAQLQERAKALGIDPTPFGDNPQALLAAIEAAEATPKMTRFAAALTLPVEISLDDWPPR